MPPERPRQPEDNVPQTISETKRDARMPRLLSEAVQRVAARNGRTASDEVRHALKMWTLLAATAVHVEPDARMLGPEHVDDVLRRLRAAATDQLGAAFPHAEPEAILSALAPPPPNPHAGTVPRSEPKTSDAA